MCRELDALRQSIATYAAAFDARSLIPAQAGEVVRLCSEIEACVIGIKSLAVAVQAEGDSHQREGYRNPEERLARETGMSPTLARRMLRAGRRLLEQPEVAAAALSGELSPEKAEAVAAGAEADPAKTSELLELAKEASVPELNDAVAKVKAEAADLEERKRAIHARRRLNRYTDLEGVFHAHLSGNQFDGVVMDQVLSQIRRKLTTVRREQDIPNDSFATLDYDAMIALFKVAHGEGGELSLADLTDIGLFPDVDVTGRGSPTAGPSATSDDESTAVPLFPTVPDDPPGGPTEESRRSKRKRLAGRPVQIIVRVDLDTLLRGYPMDGEVCDIPGYGPVPVSLIHELADTGQAKLAAVLTKGKQLTGVYLDRRHPNAYQTTALNFLYPVCAVKGCSTRAGMQADHREDWSRTHYTVLDLLDYLCVFHHNLKTREGWGLAHGTGKRDFVPPSDPRHPGYQGAKGAVRDGPSEGTPAVGALGP